MTGRARSRTLATRLVAAAWPGPLTMILRRGPRVALATTGGGRHRRPARAGPPARAGAAASRSAAAIAAPSANRFGAVSPTTADHVAADLGDDVDYILDGGPCTVGVESTIVDLSRGRPVLLRPGGMPREAIEAIVGPLAARGCRRARRAGHAREPLRAARRGDRGRPERRPGRGRARAGGSVAVLAPARAFAAGGDLPALAYPLPDDVDGMARHLYAALRDLDARGVDVVIAALPPAVGLGEAVGDRLRRAAGRREDREPSR